MPRYVVGADGVVQEVWEPVNGDAQINPKPTIVQPSAERLPFSSSGELLVDGPVLPADFLRAPDVAKLPWRRKRGDEWTDATFRAAVLAWLLSYLATRPIARRSWTVVERASASRSGRLLFGECYLTITVDGAEVAQRFPLNAREGAPLAQRLAQVATALDALLGTEES